MRTTTNNNKITRTYEYTNTRKVSAHRVFKMMLTLVLSALIGGLLALALVQWVKLPSSVALLSLTPIFVILALCLQRNGQ